MSKLFKLKRWLTLFEAAKYLTTIFGEEVAESDVLRLGLDNKLQLSVVFSQGVKASICEPVEDENVVYEEVPTLDGAGILKLPVGGQITYRADGQMLQVQKRVFELESDNPYDLSMMGGECGDIEDKYWQLVGGQKAEAYYVHGTFVNEGKRVFQLKGEVQNEKDENLKFYPLASLPENVNYVVRTNALLDLEKSINVKPSETEKPLITTERNILLSIIAVLCNVAKYDYKTPAKTASVIQGEAAFMKISIGESTIENHLKKIPNALAGRMK